MAAPKKGGELYATTLAEIALLLFFFLWFLTRSEIVGAEKKTEHAKRDLEVQRIEKIALEDSTRVLQQRIDELSRLVQPLVEVAERDNRDFYELVRDVAQGVPRLDSVKVISEMAKLLAEENTDLQGRIANLQKRCGLDAPPCWTNFEGKPEYLYKVTIHEDYIDVAKDWPRHREDDVERISGAATLAGKQVTLSGFAQMASPVLEWSKANQCRHFVKVSDAATTKDAWKGQLEMVETYFYKLIVD